MTDDSYLRIERFVIMPATLYLLLALACGFWPFSLLDKIS